MELSDIKVNPNNIKDYQLNAGSTDFGGASISNWILNRKDLDDCLAAHMTLNSYLIDKVGDCGGGYASWLNSMGIEHQSDEGWWNEAAVTPENIQAFIKTYEDEQYDALVKAAVLRYNRKKFGHDMILVSDFLEVFG